MTPNPPRHPRHLHLSTRLKWLIAVASILAMAWIFFDHTGIRYALDVNVYRLGAQRLLDGQPLYEGSFPINEDISLPFTYPPISAILFVPLTLFGPQSVSIAMNIVNIALLYGTVWFLLRRLGNLDRTSASWVAAGLAAVLSLIGPIVSTLNFGQVNMLLAAMILADALLVPRKFRGLLTGFATALKLTPAVFGLWLLLRKDWASIVRMGIGTLGLTAIAHLITPRDSTDYWLHTLAETERIGGLGYSSNQSLNGELWRLGLRTEDAGSVVWIALVLVALAATVALMLRLLRAGQPLLALCVNAFFGLLASPVSWAHHFVWVPIFLLILGLLAWRQRAESPASSSVAERFTWNIAQRRVWLCLSIMGVLCFALIPTAYTPSTGNVELEWNLGWHIIGNAYLWWTLAAYPALWFLFSPPARRHQPAPSGHR
ncbi:glycosyltransferase 87 family protein [Corynebacterium urogenitale]